MRRPSLRSQLNQIRLWVRQGRTDAWIAHKLDISVEQLITFKRDQGLDGEQEPAPSQPPAEFSELEAEEPEDEESPIAEVEPEAPEPESVAEPSTETERGRRAERYREPERDRGRERDREPERDREAESGREPESEREAEPARRRRRGRRGGRRRAGKTGGSFEATFDHGDEGYGLWLDPAVADSDVYTEHWAGHRAVSVTVEPDAITIRRADGEGGKEDAG